MALDLCRLVWRKREADGERVRRETWRKNSKIIKKQCECTNRKKKKLPFSYSAQPKIVVHCSGGAKKYRFGSTIVGHILVFGGAKNSNIAIWHHCCRCSI